MAVNQIAVAIAALALVATSDSALRAQTAAAGVTFDETIPPGANFDQASFRLWLPAADAPVKAIVLLVPGSNGDGRAETADPAWQAFAVRHRLALVGAYLTDKQRSPFEAYANVSKGSGQAIFDALSALGEASGHPELGRAPLLLWGMSAGGEVNYELVAWKPERIIAFVVNKGGIYYTALAPPAARRVPGLLFIGGKDLESRVDIITGLFALNRRGGALWALAEEPGAAHVVGKSKELAMLLFEDALSARLASDGSLRGLSEQDGFIGDVHAKSFEPATVPFDAKRTTAWLISERLARAWQAMGTDDATRATSGGVQHGAYR
jgi:dienelactone hydrolase